MRNQKPRKFKYQLVTWKSKPGEKYLQKNVSTEKTIYALNKKDAKAQLIAKYPNKTIIFGNIKKEVIRPNVKKNESKLFKDKK